MIANELAGSRIKDKRPGIVCKVDFHKAFDYVIKKFIDYILDRMGSELRWRGWIKACLSTTRFSIFFNGSAKGFFLEHKGYSSRRFLVSHVVCFGYRSVDTHGIYRSRPGVVVLKFKMEVWISHLHNMLVILWFS